jgi:hypothetical protein
MRTKLNNVRKTLMRLIAEKILHKMGRKTEVHAHLDFNNLHFNPIEHFRFTVEEMKDICRLLDIPDYICTSENDVCESVEGLALLLRRMAYPCRWCDLKTIFGRSEAWLSRVFHHMLDLVYDRFGTLVEFSAEKLVRLEDDLPHFANAIAKNGSPIPNCIGFIDGTSFETCRPSIGQQSIFSGHKRVHGLHFLSIMLPNGIIGCMLGPYEGRHTDAYLSKETNIVNIMKAAFPDAEYCLYGDAGFRISKWILTHFNSASGAGVEGQTYNFAFLDFEKNMSVNDNCVDYEIDL